MELRPKTASQGAPWYRHPFVWLLIAIPGLAVVMGAITLSLAILSYDGLVVDDYYRQGLEINRSLARDRLAERLGLACDLRLTEGSVEARLSWQDEDFSPPAELQLGLFHATRQGFDKRISLSRLSTAVYVGRIDALAPGRWHAQIEAGNWRLQDSFRTPHNGRLRLGARTSP